jgi:protein-disulfide isomerase
MAQHATAALVAQPVSLPDMALGPANAAVTITEYSSMSCPHCAAFGENVFPMLRAKYIDTGKVRFVFREFPLDIKAAAASMLARCVANGDAEKFFGTVQLLFQQQQQLMEQTNVTLRVIGKQAGMSEQAVETCGKDQALLDKLAADQRFAHEVIKVDSTPTFFVNGERHKGAMTFEELEATLKPLLKK